MHDPKGLAAPIYTSHHCFRVRDENSLQEPTALAAPTYSSHHVIRVGGYGVATISRLPKNKGLLGKRAL